VVGAIRERPALLHKFQCFIVTLVSDLCLETPKIRPLTFPAGSDSAVHICKSSGLLPLVMATPAKILTQLKKLRMPL
jgi:hypothetical protein